MDFVVSKKYIWISINYSNSFNIHDLNGEYLFNLNSDRNKSMTGATPMEVITGCLLNVYKALLL